MKKIIILGKLSRSYLSYIKRQDKCNYPPLKLWIETTSRCNLACSTCLNRKMSASDKKDMSLKLFKKIIDESKGFVLEANLFHRGEPLMHPDIAEMVRYAENSSIKTCIHTNAVLLDGAMGKKLIEAGLSKIFFSLDTFNKSDYEKNKKGADFDKTVLNIISFLKIKKDMKSKKPAAIIQLMDFYNKDSGNFFEYVHNRKFDKGAGSAKTPVNQAFKTVKNQQKNQEEFIKNKSFKFFKEQFKNLPLDRIAIRKVHNWGGNLDNSRIGARTTACTFPWYSLTIFYNGKVFLCPQDFTGKYQVGNLNDNSINEIFNGPLIQAARNNFKTNDIETMGPCNLCDRIRRKTFAGIPSEYLKPFLKDFFK